MYPEPLNFTDVFTFGTPATPSAPFGITMLSCDGSSITLAWKSPKHCGGSKINAYYIDKRDVDSLVWKEVNQEAITERICTVSIVLDAETDQEIQMDPLQTIRVSFDPMLMFSGG